MNGDPRYNDVNTRLAELLNEVDRFGGTLEYSDRWGSFVFRFPQRGTKLLVSYDAEKGWIT